MSNRSVRTIVGVLAIGLLSLGLGACSRVPAGNVGVKLYLLGQSKGVDTEQLTPGLYWVGWNEELHLFPTFTQNYVFTKDINEGSPTDESLTFQTKEGLSVNTDIGLSYYIDPNKASAIFQKYRMGLEEVTRVYLRNELRDAFVTLSSTQPIEAVYGQGKAELVQKVVERVRERIEPIGFILDGIYLVGDLRLPPSVVTAINDKIGATQKAQQRENEVRQAEAEAAKKVAEADGTAKSILAVARAQAEANKILAASITPELVRYKGIEKWDGQLPRLTGNAIPFINIDPEPVVAQGK